MIDSFLNQSESLEDAELNKTQRLLIQNLFSASWAFVFSRVNRELKQRRFWATDVNRKSKLLLFDLYNSLFVENIKS